jgi:glucose-specific phosphotransferase system IIA component
MKWINFSQLQKLGQSLMVPVSVLPGAGLVVAIGRMLQIYSTHENVVTNPVLNAVGKILFSSGLAIFEQLPVIFAIGVAIGFSGGAGIAGLSAAAAYFTLTNLLKVMTDVRGLTLAINTGVFGGIMAGLLAAQMYKRYHETRLHPVLGFFSGKRLVPIMSVFFVVFLGLILAYAWPPIQSAINDFGTAVTTSNLGPAFYAAGKRLLIPVGLHHVYYPSFLFDFGQFTTAAGEILKGDSPRYFAGDTSAGLFMASEFPIMLFGLPAAALAIVLRAKPEKRKAVAGVMLSAALTSIVTGITEPIEFAFIFVGPFLFVAHVVLAFLSGFLTHMVDLHLGYTFSASLIDFVVGFYNQKNALQLWIFVGPLMGALYFASFYFLIPALGYKTPGREDEDLNNGDTVASTTNLPRSEKAQKILMALGGPENLKALDACITRLRLTVNDIGKVNESALKGLGSAGIMKAAGGNLQVIFGTESDLIKEEMKKLIQAPAVIVAKDTVLHIGSPLSGKLIPLSEVPDATFAQGMIGPGVGIEPNSNTVVAPFDGTVVNLFHTKHAIGLESDQGVELLIHIGIDTVKMQGRGFQAFVQQGDKVKAGQKLLEFDLDLVRKEAKSIITPVIVTNGAQYKSLKPEAAKTVAILETMVKIEK